MGQCQYCHCKSKSEGIESLDSPIKQSVKTQRSQRKYPSNNVNIDEQSNALYRVRSSSLPNSTSSDSGCERRGGSIESLYKCPSGNTLGSVNDNSMDRPDGLLPSYLDLPVYDECGGEIDSLNASTSRVGSARSLGKNFYDQVSPITPTNNKVYDTSITKKLVNRTTSLNLNRSNTHNYSPILQDSNSATKRMKRSLSLRLTKKYKPKMSSDGNTPEPNSPSENDNRKFRSSQKNRIGSALSMLSASSMAKQNSSKQEAKPDKKILRQPRRRHNTVRGVSGMAIDGSNQGMGQDRGLQRSHTVYCPTKTSLKYNARRTTSIKT